MRIECDVSNLTINIREQEDRFEDDGYYSSDDVEVAISLYPQVFYCNDEEPYGSSRLDVIYLRGSEISEDERSLRFNNLSDLVIGVRAIQQYCDARNWNFESNFNVERVVLQ